MRLCGQDFGSVLSGVSGLWGFEEFQLLEAFFRSQGPAFLPRGVGDHSEPEAGLPGGRHGSQGQVPE